MEAEFRPIFFEEDFALTAFYGWREIFGGEDFRVLASSKGPFRRCLILSWGLDSKALDQVVQDAQLLDFRSEIFVQNFADPFDQMLDDGRQLNYEFRLIAGKWFRKANDSKRLLNRSTILLDLNLPESKLMENFRANTRNIIRRAQKNSVSVRLEAHSEEIINKFFEFYESLIGRFKLDRLNKKLINNMVKANKLLCFASYESTSEPTMVDLIYVCERQAYYMFSSSTKRFEIGTGQLLQWEIMRFLKAQGIRWYDLGGVRTADPTNGIFLFKRGFGGELVHWGEQLVYQPPIPRALHVIRSNLPNIRNESAQNVFNKLARTFAAQVEALKRYRSGGEQKMTVQHVHVAQGGQAIVGNVSAPDPGVGTSEKTKE
jgi:Acetyltransferase (GNAT) domain